MEWTQAQNDFSALSQSVLASKTTSDTLNQDFSALGQALQSGNLSDAQKAFGTLTQDLKQASGHHHHRRHHVDGAQEAASGSGQQNNPIAQAFDTLGQALQAGDLNGAQQAYASILQTLQQFGLSVNVVSSTAAAAGSNLAVTA